MKVKELIEHLKKMPQNLQVIYSCDEEGNNFEPVFFTPSLGYYNEECYPSFDTEDKEKKPNAVCIN